MEKNSSYAKIYEELAGTSTFRKIISEAEQALREAHVIGVEFSLQQSDNSSEASPRFQVKLGENQIAFGPSIVSWEINSSLFNRQDFKLVIEHHFGPKKDVKTRNCDKGTLFQGKYQKHKDDVPPFTSWAGDRAMFMVRDLREATAERLMTEARAIALSPEFVQRQQEELVTFCKNDITKAMLKWQGMPDEILKEAWKQFITASIMEL